MGKKVDRLILCIIVFVLSFGWGTVFIKRLSLSFIFAFMLTFLFALLLLGKKDRKKSYSHERLMTEFCLKGGDYTATLFYRALNNPSAELIGNAIKKDKTLLICMCKFSSLNKQDVASSLLIANRENASSIYIFCRGIERSAYNIVGRDIHLRIIKIGAVYKFLEKKNRLPVLAAQKQRFSLSIIAETVFRRGALKYYLFSGVVLILMSFLTPLKIYYIVLGSISLLAAILTLSPLGKGTFREESAFEKFEQSDQISIDDMLNEDKSE